jgi:hypothetical protein
MTRARVSSRKNGKGISNRGKYYVKEEKRLLKDQGVYSRLILSN